MRKLVIYIMVCLLSLMWVDSLAQSDLHAHDVNGVSRFVIIDSTGKLRSGLVGLVDTNNSTMVTLDSAGVFTGASSNVTDYGFIFVTVFSDVASATDGLETQISSDGITWRPADVFTVPAGTEKTYAFQPNKKYWRVKYTNNIVDQTVFDLQTMLKPAGSLASSHRIQDTIVDEDDAQLVKGILTGLSDITGMFENVKTYDGALQVDNSLVHKVGINEHAKAELDGSTTLDVEASVGDILINVASTTGFVAGLSFLTIGNTEEHEVGHFHATAVNAGVSLELNRPLDRNQLVGATVQEITSAMNVIGSSASPVSYIVKPLSTERWQITRILITLLDQTAMDDARFGGLAPLGNGVVIRLYKDSAFQTLTHWRSNGDLKEDMFDLTYSDKAPAGFFGLTARWTFTRAEFVADLDGAVGDYLEVLIQDDLTGLDDFKLKAQGRLFGE